MNQDEAKPVEDAGLTLIELLVVMVVAGALLVFSTGGWLSYRNSTEHRGSAQELVSALRKAQQAALTEAATYCVSFDVTARSYQTWKFACGGSGVAVGAPRKTASERVTLSSPAFLQADGSTASTVSFLPRGSATKGSVVVARNGSSKTYTVDVEGLTARVSLVG